MILFLDYDGVLHPDPCRDPRRLFENAPRLAETLAPYPEVSVVVSTSWRTVRTLPDLIAPLPETLRARVLDITPFYSDIVAASHLVPYPRHAECAAWLSRHSDAGREWFALDDRANWFLPLTDQLVVCDSQIGFDATTAARLSSRLEQGRRRLTRTVDALL